jgi:hypothetical protein
MEPLSGFIINVISFPGMMEPLRGFYNQCDLIPRNDGTAQRFHHHSDLPILIFKPRSGFINKENETNSVGTNYPNQQFHM